MSYSNVGDAGAKVIKIFLLTKFCFMKVIEALKIGQNLLKTMQENCIKVDDCRYIDLFEEYLAMTANKEKKSYIIAFLSEKYSVCERKVWYIISRFGKECKIGAE
jgi:hypothetical protein